VGGGYVWPRTLQRRVERISQAAAPDFSELAARSLIHINPVESLGHRLDGLALGRLVDLACMGACVVTHPFRGLEQMFDAGEEILAASTEEEAKKLTARARKVSSWRANIGACARRRVLKHHSASQRAHALMRCI
jgi:hypothetical protein